MRPTTFFKAISLLSILFSFAACVPDTDDVIDPNNTTAAISAKVDGQVFNALTKTAKLNGNALTIEGINSQGESIVLKTNGGLATGTYPLNVGNTGEYFLSQTTGAFVTGNAPAVGSLIINNITTDSLITGTFNFLGIRAADNLQRTITEGVFTSLKVKKNLGGTMSASINNTTNWNATNVGVTSSGTTLAIAGLSGNVTITVIIPTTITVGTTTLTPFTTARVTYTEGTTPYLGTTGTLTITTHDIANRHLVGTFTDCQQTYPNQANVNLSNGSFDVYY